MSVVVNKLLTSFFLPSRLCVRPALAFTEPGRRRNSCGSIFIPAMESTLSLLCSRSCRIEYLMFQYVNWNKLGALSLSVVFLYVVNVLLFNSFIVPCSEVFVKVIR